MRWILLDRGTVLLPQLGPALSRHAEAVLADLGGLEAVGDPLSVRVRGPLAKALTRAYHVYALPTGRRRLSALVSWALAGRRPDDITFDLIPLTT